MVFFSLGKNPKKLILQANTLLVPIIGQSIPMLYKHRLKFYQEPIPEHKEFIIPNLIERNKDN